MKRAFICLVWLSCGLASGCQSASSHAAPTSELPRQEQRVQSSVEVPAYGPEPSSRPETMLPVQKVVRPKPVASKPRPLPAPSTSRPPKVAVVAPSPVIARPAPEKLPSYPQSGAAKKAAPGPIAHKGSRSNLVDSQGEIESDGIESEGIEGLSFNCGSGCISGDHQKLGYVELEFEANLVEVERQPCELALLIDVSGSMRGEKLTKAGQAASLILKGLGDKDRCSVIAFADSAKEVRVQTGPKECRDLELSFLQGKMGKGTQFGPALIQARSFFGQQANVGRKIIIVTDGMCQDPQVALSMSTTVASGGISVSAIGIGPKCDAKRLSEITIAGQGHYQEVSRASDLPEMLRKEWKLFERPALRGLPDGSRNEARCRGPPPLPQSSWLG
jgi:uncharacterized protein YegL